jgi:cytochrome c oxidase subunit II
MESYFRLFPEQASTIAGRVDGLYAFLIGVTVFFAGLIFVLLLSFLLKYRRRPGHIRLPHRESNNWLEAAWILIPLALTMVIFVWGARLYATVMLDPPAGALEVYAIGKQWMWQFQHPDGQREIDELHVPVGHPVQMTMTSQDVIHSFFVPAFRIKMDVVPGRYTTVWFEASKPGVYHLFCAEYCGTAHSGMRGRVVALPPTQYQEWLSSNRVVESMAAAGARIFQQMGCGSCHDARGLAPPMAGVFGSSVTLASGDTVLADEGYIRESILDPRAKIVAGYAPIMPTFQGQFSEAELSQLVAYIKSLGKQSADGG